MMVEQTRFGDLPKFVPRTIDPPSTDVVSLDEKILDGLMAGLVNRPCVSETDIHGMPTGHMIVPHLLERRAIAHYLLPAVRRLVTDDVVDDFDFKCGGICGQEECERA